MAPVPGGLKKAVWLTHREIPAYMSRVIGEDLREMVTLCLCSTVYINVLPQSKYSKQADKTYTLSILL